MVFTVVVLFGILGNSMLPWQISMLLNSLNPSHFTNKRAGDVECRAQSFSYVKEA